MINSIQNPNNQLFGESKPLSFDGFENKCFRFVEKKSKMSLFHKFLFLVTAPIILLSLIQYFNYRKIILDVEKGRIPKKLAEFPTHMTSKSSYNRVKNKTRVFIDLVLEDQKTKLILNEDEINTLYSKGISLNKYLPGHYFYYEIKNNLVVEKSIAWPYFSIKGYKYQTKNIYFEFDSTIQEKYPDVNTNIQEKNELFDGSLMEPHDIKIPISYSPLISFVLDGSSSSALLFPSDTKTVEYQRFLNVLEKLKKIEVQEGSLILETE
jgi:hypothetical protein